MSHRQHPQTNLNRTNLTSLMFMIRLSHILCYCLRFIRVYARSLLLFPRNITTFFSKNSDFIFENFFLKKLRLLLKNMFFPLKNVLLFSKYKKKIFLKCNHLFSQKVMTLISKYKEISKYLIFFSQQILTLLSKKLFFSQNISTFFSNMCWTLDSTCHLQT